MRKHQKLQLWINLLRIFAIILRVKKSLHRTTLEMFNSYTTEGGGLHQSLNPLSKMSPTVHKIFVHGKELGEHALVPIDWQFIMRISRGEKQGFRRFSFTSYQKVFDKGIIKSRCFQQPPPNLGTNSLKHEDSCKEGSWNWLIKPWRNWWIGHLLRLWNVLSTGIRKSAECEPLNKVNNKFLNSNYSQYGIT